MGPSLGVPLLGTTVRLATSRQAPTIYQSQIFTATRRRAVRPPTIIPTRPHTRTVVLLRGNAAALPLIVEQSGRI